MQAVRAARSASLSGERCNRAQTQYRAISAAALLRRNLLIYGAGGIVVPFIGIKVIDLIITALRLA